MTSYRDSTSNEALFKYFCLIKLANPVYLCVEQVLVEQLRHMCLEEKVGRDGPAGKGYNALTQSAKEWTLEPSKPCSGERLLLMFDRWRVFPSSLATLTQYSEMFSL